VYLSKINVIKILIQKVISVDVVYLTLQNLEKFKVSKPIKNFSQLLALRVSENFS